MGPWIGPDSVGRFQSRSRYRECSRRVRGLSRSSCCDSGDEVSNVTLSAVCRQDTISTGFVEHRRVQGVTHRPVLSGDQVNLLKMRSHVTEATGVVRGAGRESVSPRSAANMMTLEEEGLGLR